jgi:two-component system, OmpR family, sensor kinase
MTIRTRLTLWYTAMLTLLIVIFSFAVITMNRISLVALVDQTLTEYATSIADSVRFVPVGEFGPAQPRIVVAENENLHRASLWVQVWQTHENGAPISPQLIQASENLPNDNLLNGIIPMETNIRDKLFAGTETRILSRPIFYNEQPIALVQVGMSVTDLEQSNMALLTTVSVAAVICILVSIMVGMLIANRLLLPIENVIQTASSIVKADDLKKRIPVNEPMDEVGRLAQVYNNMMERVDKLFTVQQRFVGNVSHELRTPLTSILGNLEIIQRYGYDEESLNAVYREAERMSRMANDLLLLARADNGELKVDLAVLDLDTVVMYVYEQAHILASKRNLKILLDDIDDMQIMGNLDRLKQLFLNLVANAIKFTPDGGTVSLLCYQQGKFAIVEVRDTGIGISNEDQKRIFDRFFQSDNSRVHRSESDGAGLGLSIARWIVEAHHATIHVDSELGKGTTFRISFPLLERKRTTKQITKEWVGIS